MAQRRRRTRLIRTSARRAGQSQRQQQAGRRLGLLPSRRIALALVCCVALVATVGVFVLGRSRGLVIERADNGESLSQSSADAAFQTESSEDDGSAAQTTLEQEGQKSEESASLIIVDVAGQVVAPGVYKLSQDQPRVNDALEAAGGLAEEADTSTLNLAAKLSDGEKVYVPSHEEVAAGSVQATADTSSSTQSQSGSASQGSSSSSSSLVNINTATAEELQQLPGVGPSTAAAIVEERQNAGAFSSIEDIMRVSGIGEKKFAKLKGSICV